MPFSVITNKSNSESSTSNKTGPTLASSVLGFTALSILYPGGMNSFMYNAINKTLPAQLLRIVSVTTIFGLTTNLSQEYRTNKTLFSDPDLNPTPKGQALEIQQDFINPVIGGLVTGAVIELKKKSIKRMLLSSAYFSVGMYAYSELVNYLEPKYDLKNFELETLLDKVFKK